MAECAKVAAENANISANKYKSYFDLKSQNRQFRPGDEVLVLLPDCSNKLLVSWNGPFKVLERRNRVNYLIDDKGNAKLYHANLLKRYYRRTNVSLSQVLDENPVSEEYNHYNPLTVQFCIKDEHDEIDDCELPITPDGKEFNSTSEVQPLQIFPELTNSQTSDINNLVTSFAEVFSEVPVLLFGLLVRVLVGFVRGRSCTVIHLEDKECEIVSLHSSLSRGTLLLPRAGHRGVPSNLPNSRHYFGKPQTPQLLLLRPCPCTHYLFHVKPSVYTMFGYWWSRVYIY
ncbi:hypothetical protein Pmani_009694 [Petrolisthes manimaculis]|uniref:Uncharacterized protein n=1 Tax=Petrolisthes manimaculis TaxID=1843537 RepID=A0AAE1Q492_9EUCA|nr:hypothetical protein Pmani_009694 [Petrolisthes manimaculis]